MLLGHKVQELSFFLEYLILNFSSLTKLHFLVLFCFSDCVAVLLDTASKVIPFVICVSGRVGSETPIKCEYSGLRGVIVEETV